MVRRRGLAAGRSGVRSGAVAGGARGLEPSRLWRRSGWKPLSPSAEGLDLPRGCARVEGKADPGSSPGASVALTLCVSVCPGFWSRREPRADRGALGETDE